MLVEDVKMGAYAASVVNALFTNDFILDVFWPTQTVHRGEASGRTVIDKDIAEWIYKMVYQVLLDNKISTYNRTFFCTSMGKAMNNRRHMQRKLTGKVQVEDDPAR